MVSNLTDQQIADIYRESLKDSKYKDILFHYFKDSSTYEQFCSFVLPDAFTCEFAEFHEEIHGVLFSNENEAFAEPRGHGKSTDIGQGFVMHNILYKKEKFIVYISQNYSKTISFLEPLKHELKTSRIIKHIWGNLTLKKVKDEDNPGKDREDCYDIGDVRLQACSYEGNMRGLKHGNLRPTLIILDDIEDDERVLNPELRRKDANKLNKIIIPALDIDGKYKFFGTILHLDSQLKRKILLLNGKIYKACILSETEKIEHTYKGRIRLLPKILPNSILFPQRFTQKKLYDLMCEIGSSEFQSEYLNNPVDNVSSLIKREWVVASFDEELTFGEANKYDFMVQGVDFAFSDRVTADKSAYLGVGKTTEGYTLISCFIKQGLSITAQFDYIEYLAGIYNFDDNALEENSIRSMSDELKLDPETGEKRWNFNYTLFWTGANDSAKKRQMDSEFDGKRHTIGKTAMIKRLATQFENGRIKIPYKTEKDKETAHMIMDECCTYALSDGKLVEVGPHGDIPIALGLAIERSEMERIDVEVGVLEI